MAKVSKEPVYPHLGRPGMYRQVVECGHLDSVDGKPPTPEQKAEFKERTARMLNHSMAQTEIAIRDGVALRSAAHPSWAKVHGNRGVRKKAVIGAEVEIDDRIMSRPKAEKREVAKEALAVGEKRGKGRPKSTKPKPWEAEGISKALWYRRRRVAAHPKAE